LPVPKIPKRMRSHLRLVFNLLDPGFEHL